MEKASTHFFRLAGKIVGSAAILSVAVLVLGYFLGWQEPVQYSNAFFWAGAIWVVLGVFTVAGGFTQRANFGIAYSETAGVANISERNQRAAAEVVQRYGTMIFMIATGLLLIGVAVAIGNFLIG